MTIYGDHRSPALARKIHPIKDDHGNLVESLESLSEAENEQVWAEEAERRDKEWDSSAVVYHKSKDRNSNKVVPREWLAAEKYAQS